MTALERQFHQAMLQVGQSEQQQLGYYPIRFLDMVHRKGGLATAKQLLRTEHVSYGFLRLKELDRLDLTLEALVLQEQWSELFTDGELAIARRRLETCH